MKITVADLPQLIRTQPEFKIGCVIDTNAFFAASTTSDRINAWAEKVFNVLRGHSVPAFTNINIRSEYLELQRRVLIPEGLLAFYEASNKETMNRTLKAQLSSLKTQVETAIKDERLFKFNDQQIKKYRALMQSMPGADGGNAWDAFCASFLRPYIARAWDENVELFNIQFAGTRAIESGEHFNQDPSWKDAIDIVGRFGIGMTDAMIINFFLHSKFPMIVTGDEDVAYVVERMAPDSRFVLVCEGNEDAA